MSVQTAAINKNTFALCSADVKFVFRLGFKVFCISDLSVFFDIMITF